MEIPARTTAVPMTFMHQGKQYVVFATGAGRARRSWRSGFRSLHFGGRMRDRVSRRAFLAAAGAAGAAWLAADPALVHAALEHARQTAAATPPYQFVALTAAEAAGLEAIAMRILPSDETPGAKEAGVIHFMDKALATYAADRKAPVLKGLDDLNRRARSRWPGTTPFASATGRAAGRAAPVDRAIGFLQGNPRRQRHRDVRQPLLRRQPESSGMEAAWLPGPRGLPATLRLLRRRSPEGRLTMQARPESPTRRRPKWTS